MYAYSLHPIRKSTLDGHSSPSLTAIPDHRRRRLSGFSLVELIVVLGLIVVGAGVGTAVVSKVQTAAMDAKLSEDVDQVNSAISLYVTGGGNLNGVTDPQAVLDRLKTVTTTEGGNDREIMFAKRSMIDQRLAVVTSADSRQRGLWKWSGLHAKFNAGTKRFEIVSGPDNGTIRGFTLDDAKGAELISAERRDVVFRQAKNDPWVWDFDPSSTSAPTNLPTGVAGTDTTATVRPPAALTGAVRALPPGFDPEPPQDDLNEYPLSVTLINPNNTVLSRVLYHLEPGAGLDMPAKGQISVDPGTKIVAFVQSLDDTTYIDSEVATRTYTPSPVVPQLEDTLAPAYSYLEVGGPLAGGSPIPEVPVPARITLSNGSAIPNIYENDSGFRVYWTYDDSDPKNSPTLTQGTTFFESYPGEIVPVRLSDFSGRTEMTVKYYAKAHNTNAFSDSPVTGRNVGINKLTLPAPVLSTPASTTIVSGPVSMYADVSTGLVPAGYRIFYTTDGDDPGDLNGEPEVQALQYTGPVNNLTDTSIVVARVYPPSDHRHWFNVSPPTALQIGTPIAALYYAVGDNNRKIYVFDPNGSNVVKSSTALFPIECIAADASNTRIYYIERADAQWRLGLYNVATGDHKNLGRLDQDFFFDRPVSQPTNLMFFNDGLYYVHENSDNLVKIELNNDEVAQQFRVADITGDSVAFTGIGDIVADANGKLILSATNAFATYDLRKMADYKELSSTPSAVWSGLVMTGSGYLLGVKSDSPSVLHAVNLANGSASTPVNFSPVRSFTDFAGPQGRVLTEPVGGQHFFVTNGQSTIHRLDMSTGRNYLVTTLLPMQPTGIAIDRTNSLIYTVGFDDSTRTGDAFLTRFDLTTGQITDLGSLKDPSWAYRPVSQPVCLTYFQNKLYYVPTDTDDLVKIEFNATEITAQSLAADILDNAGDLGDVDALTIGPDGWLYLSRSDTDLLAKYQIGALGNYTVIKSAPEAAYQALTFDIYGQLHGTLASKPRQVWLTDESTGESTWQFDTQPNLAVWDITGMFDTTPPPITNDYFAVDGSSSRIFRIDPDTGWNQVFTATPWIPDTIAFDTDSRRIYYLRRAAHTLGVYDIRTNTHSVLGEINNPSFSYVPAARPFNLTCFNGALYYVTPNTDDLVKIEIDPFGRMGQSYKAADLRNNSAVVDFVGDLAVNANGILHISSDTLFATFDMRTLGDFTVVAPTAKGRYAGLLFTIDGKLKGTRVEDTRVIHSIALDSGASISAIPSVPFRGFGDLAGPQNRVPVNVPQGRHYFAQAGSSVIRELDISTGGNRVITWAAPWNIGGIAYDPETKVIYYSETPGGQTETHLAKYEVELDRHTELGSLTASGLGYVPSAMPKHLVFFCGDIYYIAQNTDDLIKVTIDDRQVLTSEKLADINSNTSLGDIGSVAVDNIGWMYFSRQSGGLLARFNLHTKNRYSVISSAASANYQGLTFDASNVLHGFPVTTPASMYTLNATGVPTLKGPTSPSQAIWDITGNNSCPPPDIPGNYYGVTGGNRRIYKFDPATGVTGVMTNTAPFYPRALARDPNAGILYYIEDTSTDFRLGKYTLSTNLHASLGKVDDATRGDLYVPVQRPTNLFFYGGAIFYIAAQTDDLVMITVDNSQITSQVKVADLTNNARTFANVGDVAVDASGRAYGSASDGTFFSFNMKTLGAYTVHGNGRPYYYGLLFTDTGTFHGVHGSQATSVQNVAPSNGASTFAATTTPDVSFLDYGGNEVSVPWERSDSLWGLISESAGQDAAWSWGSSPAAPNGGVTSNAGAAWQGVSLRYDEGTRILTGDITLDKTALDPSTGASHWQAVSFALGTKYTPVSNSTSTHAWVLLDYSTGAPRLSVYRYDADFENTRSNPVTILNGTQTAGSLRVTDAATRRTFSFALNLTPVQNHSAASTWRGAEMAGEVGATLRAWSQPAVTYDANQQVTQWAPNKSGSGSTANHASLIADNVPAQSLTGRLVEFKNYRTPAIQATDWGILYYHDGAGLVPLGTTSGLESLTISASGTAYFVKNGPTAIGGFTYRRPVFKLEIGSQSPGKALAATFVGDLQRGLTELGAAAGDPVTGLALSPSGQMYGVLRAGDGGDTDLLFTVANLLRDSSNQLINVLAAGPLEGNGHTVTSAEDISFNSDGTLYVSDAYDGQIYSVNTSAQPSLALTPVSLRSGISYRALAINPSDNDLTVSDTLSNTVRKVVPAGSTDPVYFDYGARFDYSDVRALSFFNGSFAPTDSTAPYYAANHTNRIYAVNPSTGATTLVTATAPFKISSLALDAAGGQIYYTEDTDGAINLGRYSLATSTHTVLGSLASPGFAYTPARNIQNLVFFAGDLYYVHSGSDDLVKISLSAAGVTGQEKEADLNLNSDLGIVTGAALNDAGILFLCNGTSLYKYNLRSGNSFTTVSSGLGSYESLMWNSAAGTLNGAPSAALSRIDSIAPTTGTPVPGVLTAPAVSMHDLTGPHSAVPLTGLASSLFAVTGGSPAILVLDPRTGVNSLLDSGAPFNLRSLALDSDNGILYYTEDTSNTTTFRLGLYNLNTGTHTQLGNLRGSGAFAYNPAESPSNLAYYGGSLYYIPRNSDDLIKVTTSATGISSQVKVLDIRNNTPFTDVGDLATSSGGFLYFGDRAAGFPMYRLSLAGLNNFQSFGSTTRFLEASAIFEGAYYGASATGATTIDGYSPGATSLAAGATAATSPPRSFIDMAGPAAAASIGRSSSLWAVVETPSGHLVEIRNHRSALAVESVDYGEIFYLDGSTTRSLTANSVKIKSLAITPTGRAFFTQNDPITFQSQSYQRPLFYVDLPNLVLGSPVMATFVGDMAAGLAAGGGLGSSDNVSGLAASPDGALYGLLNYNNSQTLDKLFRLTSLRVNASKSLTDLVHIGNLTGAGFTSTSAEDIAFTLDGTLVVADDTTDQVYKVQVTTGAILSSYSYENNIQYLALAVDPADGAVLGSHVSGGNEKSFRIVTPGSTGDTVLWDYRSRFGWTRTEAIAFYLRPFAGAEGSLYAIGTTGKTLYSVSPLTGQTTPISLAAANPAVGSRLTSLAYSALRHTLFYTDSADAQGNFRLYRYDVAANQHSLLGQLNGNNFPYTVNQPPTNLACINNELFFIHASSDDLVRITLDGNTIASVQKVADMGLAFTSVGDLSVRDDGILFFAAGNKLWRYDLNQLSGLNQVSATSQAYNALTFASGNLVANRVVSPSSLHLVNSQDGSDALLASTSPPLAIADLASAEPRVVLPRLSAAPYYGANRTRTLYTVDPVTAATTVLSSSAPYNIEAVAHDKVANVIYYVENNSSTVRLGKFDIGLSTHTQLGDLKSSSLAYRPATRPENLAIFDGSLYYVAPDTDDLVRVRITPVSILSQERVTDLNNDLSLGIVRAATVDDAGRLYFSYGSTLARYDLRQGGAMSLVSSTFPATQGLLWYPTQARLAAVAVDSPFRIDAVALADGIVTSGPTSTPTVSFADLAGGNTAPPPTSAFYYAVNRSTTIYRLDPITGVASALPTLASFALDSIAYDEAKRVLYVIENTNTNTRIGRYELDSNTFRSLGNMLVAGQSHVPTERPQHLTVFAGDLYYVNYHSSTSALRDDLIRIRVSDTALVAQEKVIDLNNNTGLNRVTAATVDDAGMLYLAAGSELKKFNLRQLNGLTNVSITSPVWSGLLWSRQDGFQYGTNSSTTNSRNQLSRISTTTGVTTFQADVIPNVSSGFYDIASGNNAQPHPSLDVPRAYIGGEFATSTGTHRNLARLAADGSLDTTFNPGTGANAPVRAVLRQDDGRVLAGGEFTQFNGETRRGLVRVNPNGSTDTSFMPNIMAAGSTSEINLDWGAWTSFTQNSPLSGADTYVGARDAYYGLASASGGVTGFGSQAWSNVNGSGVNLTLHYSQNMTEAGGGRDGVKDGPDLHGPTTAATGGANPDRRITGANALRFNSDRVGTVTPVTVVASFSEPVYLNQAVWGSLQQIGGAASVYGANLVPNGSFENGPGWNSLGWFPSDTHPNRAQARLNQTGAGIVDNWSIDGYHWIGDAGRATDGNKSIFLKPSDQSWNFSIGQEIGVGTTATASTPLVRSRNYRILFDCVTFNPSLPDGMNASPMEPAVELQYRDTANATQFTELYNLQDTTTGLAPGNIPATNWTAPQWRTVSAHFTAPLTHATSNKLQLWISNKKKTGMVQPTNYMADYNTIVFENLTSSSDLDGKTWIGGDLIGTSSFQLGNQYSPSTAENVVVVAGVIQGGAASTAINFGVGSNSKLAVKDLASRGLRPINWNGGGSQSTRLVIDPSITSSFQKMRSDLTARSQVLRLLPANSTMTTPGGQPNARQFICNPATMQSQNGMSVFSINASDLFSNGTVAQVDITSATGNAADVQGVIINVAGTSVNWTSSFNFVGNFVSNSWRQKVIWNFHQAATLACGARQMNGAVLAPLAAVTSANNFDGSLVCRSLTTTGECHRVPFTSTAVANVGLNMGTSGMLVDNVRIQEVTTTPGYFENAYFRAFSTPDATGTPLAADRYENLSLRSDPLLGTAADPLTENRADNVRLDPTTSDNIYHTIGTGRQEENKHGRVSFSYTTQAVRSVAFTFWTSQATETLTGQVLPRFDGTLTANPSAATLSFLGFSRANPPLGKIYAMVEQPDGKIVVGGDFGQVNGIALANVARLNPDGTLDSTFYPGQGPNGPVYSLALQPDGSVLAGGSFSSWNGQISGNRLVRVTSSGARDTSFQPVFSTNAGDTVNWIGLDSAGRVLAGGKFSAPHQGIVRLTSTGATDSSFNPGTGTSTASVYTGLLNDGDSLLIAGDFTTVGGTARNRIARLGANGALDTAWNPGTGFDGLVQSMVRLNGSEYIHTGGGFSSFQGAARNKAAVVGTAAGDAGRTPWGPTGLNITRVWTID